MPAERTTRRDVWPWILAALLGGMIAVSSTFAWVAHHLPDPQVVDKAYEESGGALGFRPRNVSEAAE